MFKKHTRTYQSEGIEHSPFAHAAQVWDDRIGSARVQARNWRVMAFACMTLTVVLIAALIYQSAQTRIEAYVIEVDPQGRPGEIELIDNAYSPTSAQVAFHIAELIRKVRGRPTDPIVLRQNWEQAYRFLAGDAIRTMNEYAVQAEPFASTQRGMAVAVKILNVIQRSEGSFQVRWKETAYEHGSEAEVRYWTGLFTTEIVPPETAETLLHNPLGVYVTNFSWSQELNRD